jgi:hypothetical protein
MMAENKENTRSQQAIITDDFMDWEERDASSISLFKHCIAGKSHSLN